MKNTDRILVLVVLAIGAILLFWNLELYDIWGDEALTFPKGNNFADIIKYTKLVSATVHPPTYSLVQFAWMKWIAGWDLSSNRFLWAAFGFISLIVVYFTGKELFNRKVALAATLLCALSPFLVQYSRMIRYYSLTMLLALLTIWTFARLKRTGKWRDCIFFILSGAAFLYEDYLASLVLFFLYIYLFFNFRIYRNQLWKWLLAATVIILLFLPQLPVFFSQAGGEIEPYPEHLDKVIEEAPRVAQRSPGVRGIAFNSILKLGFLSYVFTLGETTYFWRWWITIPVLLTFLSLFILVIVKWTRRDLDGADFLILPFFGTLIAATVISEIHGVFGSRMFQFPSKVMFLTPFLFLLSAGVWYRIQNRVVQILLAIIILAGDVYGLNNYYSGHQFLNPKYLVPWREIQLDIEKVVDEHDLILTDEEAFFHNLRATGCPIESFGLVGAAEKVEQTLTELGPFHVYLLIRYRGDETIVMEGLNVQKDFEQKYLLKSVWNYVPSDPEAAPFWTRMLGREPPDYFVKVFLFHVGGEVGDQSAIIRGG